MDDKKIIDYIKNEYENEFLDFKLEIYDWKNLEKKEDFLKDVIALANSTAQGDKYIILGAKIKENGERVLKGIDTKELKDSAVYQQIVVENIEPEISIEVKPIEVDGLTYGIVRIFNCNNKPYLLRKKYGNLEKGYMVVRKGSRNTNISRYILDDIYNAKKTEINSEFKIVGLENGKITDNIKTKKYDFLPNIEAEREVLIKLLKEINEFVIDDIISDKADEINGELSDVKKALMTGIMNNPKKISEETVNSITAFAKAVNIELNEGFFDIGDLSEAFAGMRVGGEIKYNINGSKLSQEKYNMILKLSERLNRLVSWFDFKEKIKDFKYIELAITEIGNTSDEEIEINIKIPQDIYINYEKFPEANTNIIDEINEYYAEKMFKPEYKSDISDYRKMPLSHGAPSYVPHYTPLFGYNESKIIEGLYNYIDYDVDYNNGYAVLTFTIKNIKEKETMIFPGKILLSGDLDKIEYSIISKNSKEKIDGILKITH